MAAIQQDGTIWAVLEKSLLTKLAGKYKNVLENKKNDYKIIQSHAIASG